MIDHSVSPTALRQYSEPLRGLSVRAANILHKVGVNLWLATRDEALVGLDLALSPPRQRGCGNKTLAELRRHRDSLVGAKDDTRFWFVTVSRNSEDLVTITDEHTFGRVELTDEDKRIIRLAADRLFALVGPAEGWSPFIVPDDEGEPGNMGL